MELKKALSKLKNGKASGSSGILPEMVKVAAEEEEFLEFFLLLVHQVWEERRVSQEWVDVTLIPIPKKGNLGECNNWRGISLLDVAGKAVARILQRGYKCNRSFRSPSVGSVEAVVVLI